MKRGNSFLDEFVAATGYARKHAIRLLVSPVIRHGKLLKYQVPVRTFTDWDDAQPGVVRQWDLPVVIFRLAGSEPPQR